MPSNYATPETPRPAPAVRLPFPEARAMVRLLGLRTPTQYRAYLAGRGRDMPKPPAVGALTRYPHIHYRGQGWVGWDDYLGLDLPRVEVPQPPPEAALAAATPESVEAPEPTPISEPPRRPQAGRCFAGGRHTVSRGGLSAPAEACPRCGPRASPAGFSSVSER